MSFNEAYECLIEFDLNESQKKTEKKETMKKDPVKQEDTRKRPSPKSLKPKVEPKREEIVNYDIPDRKFGDLYCVLCESHMNSDQMWESHISGKRHIKAKNSKKGESVENKYEYCDEEPTIQKELENVSKPIAGLDHICEILSDDKPPTYQCFLCSASLTTSKLLMEHILGLKHQLAFLKEHVKKEYTLLYASTLSKSYLEPIVEDLIRKYASEHGRGKMSVKKMKGKSGSSSSKKKSYDDDDDRPHSSTKSSKRSLAPKSSRYSPRSPSHSPPRSRYSPPPKASRYSPPPKASRYSPPPKSSRYSPPSKSSRFSPPQKSSRRRGRTSESDEWLRVSPVQERMRESSYPDRSLYPEEENWAKIETEPPVYRGAPSNLDIDTRFERTIDYNHARSPAITGRDSNDLRAVLQQKKSLGVTRANGDGLASTQVSSKRNDVSDSLLRLIDDMSPEVFLGLALFKLDNMCVQNEMELKLLDSVVNKATALALEVKKKLPVPDLKVKYKEALAQNGISCPNNSTVDSAPQNSLEFTQNLDNLIGHYKARKTTVYDDTHSQDSYSSRLISSDQYTDNRSSHPQLNSSQYRNSQERASSFDSEWNQRSSSTSVSFQSFSSTPTYIPGLTLTEEPPAQPPTSTVLSQFAQTAKSIFGNINVPSTSTTPYQNEDYNRLNYRY